MPFLFQITDCHRQYLKLGLTREGTDMTTSVSPLPYIFSRSKTSASRFELTSGFARSAPPILPLNKQTNSNEKDKNIDHEQCLYDEMEKFHPSIDPIRLCEHLRDCGFGSPVMLTSSAKHEISRYNLPPGVRARRLPRNPSKREKIKGRARLDYEMANMRALAFCEQQTPKMFRTASAHMRNRDVQFVEDEMKEHVQRGEEIDDTGSVVMAIDKEELFQRIETWIEDVAKSIEKSP